MALIKKIGQTGAVLAAQLVDTDKNILLQMQMTDRKRHLGDHNNTMPVVDVPIPPSVHMSCPKVGKYLRQVSTSCINCECYKGISQIGWSDEVALPWPQRYAVLCAHTLERAVTQVVSE